MARIVLPFGVGTIGTPGARYGERTYRDSFGRWVTHFHCAVDFQVVAGSAVRAAAAGRVVEVSHSRVRGFMIAIDHGDGTGHRFHMIASRGRPKVGTQVRQGQVIGYVADDDEQGSSSNGDHVHMEYRVGRITGETAPRANTPNPLSYLAGTAGGTGTPLEGTMNASDVWNYDIGANGTGGKDDTPAWIRLSWAHADGARNRQLLEKHLAAIHGDTAALFAALLGPIDAKKMGLAGDNSTGSLVQRLAWMDKRIRESEAREIGLQAAITALATAQGMDAAALTAHIKSIVDAALANIEVTLRPVAKS